MARRHDPAVDREQQLEIMTGETELARHDEQLERQEETPAEREAPTHAGRRGPAVLPSRRGRAYNFNPQHSPDTIKELDREEFGANDHQLPGGILHQPLEQVQGEVLHPKIPGPYYDGAMAHGVPIDTEHPPNEGRVQPMPWVRHSHEVDGIPHHEAPEVEPDPVPVYLVERGGGGRPLLKTSVLQIQVPATGSDPVRLTSRDLKRSRVALMNEDSTNDVRFSHSLAALGSGRGALLPHGMGNYLWLHTQDDLYAVGTSSSTVKLSLIQEYEVAGGG